MRIVLLLFSILHLCYGYNYLISSPVFGYSHLKFMSKVADTLANAGHNVTMIQFYVYEHFGKINMVKNKNIKIIDYHNTEEAPTHENSASAFAFMWDSEIVNNPITGAFAPSIILFKEFKPMCEKVLLDKELHKFILDGNFDGYISETFDFCGLFLGDHLNLNIIPMFSAVKSLAVAYTIGEPSLINFFPAPKSQYGEEAGTMDRVNDLIALTGYYHAFARLADKQYVHANEVLKGQVRHWHDILQTSTFYFTNSNPYITFPIPTLTKTVEVGGFAIDPPKHLELPKEYIDILNLRKYTVLISFGTVVQSADMPDAFKDGIIQVCKTLKDTTFLWKYEVDDEVFLKKLPENVIVKKWIPQPALLENPKLSLFITHGGLGSTLEVAYAGKPTLMIPIFGDQLINAQNLARHGGAKVFDKYDLAHPDRLETAINDVLHNQQFNQSAILMADILKHQPIDPKTTLLRHLEFVARFGRVETLEPYNTKYNFIRYYALDAYLVLIAGFLVVLYVLHLFVKFIWRCICGKKKVEKGKKE